MNDLKYTVAVNIARLRTAAGMKQSDLAEKINYSDKSVSKWERAVSLPDVAVLKQIADTLGVTVDYLITEHDDEETAKIAAQNFGPTVSRKMIIAVVVAGIWVAALLLFIIFWLLGSIVPVILASAVPVSLLAYLVLNSVWYKGKYNLYIVSGLVLSLIALFYLIFIKHNWWQILLLSVPVELIIVFGFNIIRPHKN